MRLVLHPEVHSDVKEIMDHYEELATPELANEFYQEFVLSAKEAAIRSLSSAIRKGKLRRVNLHRFPYHFLFRIADDVVRILVVRHHGRDPALGISRR